MFVLCGLVWVSVESKFLLVELEQNENVGMTLENRVDTLGNMKEGENDGVTLKKMVETVGKVEIHYNIYIYTCRFVPFIIARMPSLSSL